MEWLKPFPKKMPDMFHRAYTWVARIDRSAGENDKDKYRVNDENLQVQHGRTVIPRWFCLEFFPATITFNGSHLRLDLS